MEKIKQLINETLQSEKGRDILVVIIIILVGSGSFELGRLSKENSNTGVKVEYPNQDSMSAQNKSVNLISANVVSVSTQNGKNYFASSKGSKYYSLGCSAGKNIKQENKVYFATREGAEKAGYSLSSSCK